MPISARFAHANLIAADWRRLARFYEEVFGCVPVPPERDVSGPALDAGTGLSGARLRGAHLRLPGHGPGGPTLEIFQYGAPLPHPPTAPNRQGFAHIAFAVDNVATAREVVLAHGGRPLGDIVTLATTDGQTVTWTYVTDPEGNILELQRWSV